MNTKLGQAIVRKARETPHRLKVISLYDAQAKCEDCGWHYSAVGSRTKAEVEYQFNLSHRRFK